MICPLPRASEMSALGRLAGRPDPGLHPRHDVDLDQILCHEELRTVGQDNAGTLERLPLQLARQPGRRPCTGLQVLVRRHLTGQHSVWHGLRCLGYYGAAAAPQPAAPSTEERTRPFGSASPIGEPPRSRYRPAGGSLSPPQRSPPPDWSQTLSGQITCQNPPDISPVTNRGDGAPQRDDTGSRPSLLRIALRQRAGRDARQGHSEDHRPRGPGAATACTEAHGQGPQRHDPSGPHSGRGRRSPRLPSRSLSSIAAAREGEDTHSRGGPETSTSCRYPFCLAPSPPAPRTRLDGGPRGGHFAP